MSLITGVVAKQGMNDIWPLIVCKLDNTTFGNISRTRLWFDIAFAIRSDAFWSSRVGWLLSVDTRDLPSASSETWKKAFYELQEAVLSPCPFSRLACAISNEEEPELALAAQSLLQAGRLPSNVRGVLNTACQTGKKDLARVLLEDERVGCNAAVITDLIRSVTLVGLAKCLDVLLPLASASDINANLNSGVPFRNGTAALFLAHPLCRPTGRMFSFAIIHISPNSAHLILQNKLFDMKQSIQHLTFSLFIGICRERHSDHVWGYEFGVAITKSDEVPNNSYDALLRILIAQNRTTSECLEYIHENRDLEQLAHGFSRLLEPDMTFDCLTRADAGPLLIRTVCAHLGAQRLTEEGIDVFALLR